MKRVFCDICNREIKDHSNTWMVWMNNSEFNRSRTYNSRHDEICEECTKAIYKTIRERRAGA